MSFEVIMPRLGSTTMESGGVLEWMIDVGEHVEEGDGLVEVEGDKATIVVPAPVSGRLTKVIAQPGDEVPVGQAIAEIEEDDGA